MQGSIRLTVKQRKTLLSIYRGAGNARVARRAQVLLLLADGLTYSQIKTVLYGSNDLIAGCVNRFESEGLEAALGINGEETVAEEWVDWCVDTLTEKSPRDFGYFRSRWSCEVLAEVLAWEKGIRLNQETVRQHLRRAGFVWGRPRPVVGPDDPEYRKKLGKVQRLLKHMPDDETAVFQDEVDIDLNPKLGNCWMLSTVLSTWPSPGQKSWSSKSVLDLSASNPLNTWHRAKAWQAESGRPTNPW